MQIINAQIHTQNAQRQIISKGYIRFFQGKIAQIGDMAAIGFCDKEETIDAGGAALFPGFVDAHTHLGMWEDSLGFEGDDGNEETDPATPQLRSIDAINPLDRSFSEALAAGITTVVTGPGSANPIGGQMLAMKTFGRRIDDMLVRDPVAMKFALGENPKKVYYEKNQTPVTRMATAAIIREQLVKARRYADDIACAENDPEIDLPDYDAKSHAMMMVVEGQLPVHIHAHRADDIFTAVRIAEEFGLKYAVIHATEGSQVADILADHNVRILSGPLLCDRSKPELKSLTPSTPGILVKAGVQTAIVSDHPCIPVQYLPLCAGLAVREGMAYDDALAAITCNAAAICHIEDRVGSLEPGKDGDAVLFDSDPLTLSAKPRLVVCNGRIVFRSQ